MFKLFRLIWNYFIVYIEKKVSGPAVSTDFHKIRKMRNLTESTFVLRLDRWNMQFKAGQHIIVGLKGELNQREYSVYSGENDDYLEILVREVLNGNVSLQLKQCNPGQLLQVNGPFGSFGWKHSTFFPGNWYLLHRVQVLPRFTVLSNLLLELIISFFMESVIIMKHTKEIIMIPAGIFCVLQKRVTEVIKEESQGFYQATRWSQICYFMCAVTTV